jgi:hypothetical protein
VIRQDQPSKIPLKAFVFERLGATLKNRDAPPDQLNAAIESCLPIGFDLTHGKDFETRRSQAAMLVQRAERS